MNSKDFSKLIKKEKYQVFIMSCPCSLPISFISHTWITINKKGRITRYAGSWIKNDREEYVYIESPKKFLPHEGIAMIPLFYKIKWRSKLICSLEGKLAKKIIDFIEKRLKRYPELKIYHFYPGPNSNTFVQWVLNYFPESNIKLPWNAIGKDYIIKKREYKL